MTPKQKAKAAAVLFGIAAAVVGIAFTFGSGVALLACRFLPFCD